MDDCVLILEPDNYSSEALAKYRLIGKVIRYSVDQGKYSPEQVIVLVVRLKTFIGKDLLNKFNRLRYLVSPTTGLNHIDLDECIQRQIKVISLRDRTSFLDKITSTSELTLGLMLSLIRRIPEAHEVVCKQLMWDRDMFRTRQLNKMVLGIIGFGRIGRHILKYARTLGMRSIVCDPYVPREVFKKFSILSRPLNELLEQSDIISIHVDYRVENEGLIDVNAINLMKRGSYLINTSRGELIDEAAVVEGLKSGKLAGVAVDVLLGEQYGDHMRSNLLVKYAQAHNNIIVTPHIGGCTSDAMEETEIFVAQCLLEIFQNERGDD